VIQESGPSDNCLEESCCAVQRPRLNYITLQFNNIQQRYFEQQKTVKTGSRFQKSKVLINTTK